MELKLIRKTFTRTATIGELFVNGTKFADTLEDAYRPLPPTCPNTPRGRDCACAEKVYGETCIPPGTYTIEWRFSPKFKGYYPALLNVPHFRGVLIHAGATVAHTQGCILTGEIISGKAQLKNQFDVTNVIKRVIKDAIENKENVSITIINKEL